MRKGPVPYTQEQREQAFNSYVDRSAGPDACHVWTGFRYPRGYGQFHVARRPVYAHRFAWETANAASVLPGFEVRHSCDNPPCVNKRHLLLGTKSMNMQDAVERGRHRHFRGIGEDNPRAKLSAADVASVRALLGTITQADLAQRFGVSRQAISNIACGRSWAGAQIAETNR